MLIFNKEFLRKKNFMARERIIVRENLGATLPVEVDSRATKYVEWGCDAVISAMSEILFLLR